jgi:DNA processing protein
MAVYQATREKLLSIQGLRSGFIETLLSQRSLDTAKGVQEHMRRCQIDLLTYDDPYFPSYTNRFSSLPAVLYYRGNLRAPTSCIGIVGSRRCTSYGKEVAAEAAAFLGQAGVTVVSGMAKGIDSYAHTACLKAGGYTLAFVANGVDICYPPEHQTLMEEIIENGAVFSSYPPGTRPRQEYFPYRNKLLAAWVDKLLVVEAADRSGALITAKYAMEYKRKVLAVPNSIYSPESAGANRLLFSGAEVYIEPQQLIDNDGIEVKRSSANEPINQPRIMKKQEKLHCTINPQEQAILDRLDQPQAVQNLLGICNGDMSVLLELLCQMELEGKVVVSGQNVKGVR